MPEPVSVDADHWNVGLTSFVTDGGLTNAGFVGGAPSTRTTALRVAVLPATSVASQSTGCWPWSGIENVPPLAIGCLAPPFTEYLTLFTPEKSSFADSWTAAGARCQFSSAGR